MALLVIKVNIKKINIFFFNINKLSVNIIKKKKNKLILRIKYEIFL